MSPGCGHGREALERVRAVAAALAPDARIEASEIHSIEEAEGLRFITMEHVEGETLGQAISGSGFPIERFLKEMK